MSDKLKSVQKLFDGFSVVTTKNGYPYAYLPLTDFCEPMESKHISYMADLMIKEVDFSTIDVIVSEGDRGGGPLTQEIAKKVSKPFVLANWYPQKIRVGQRVRAKVGFSGEGYIYLMGIKKEQKVVIVEDLISSGGTILALIESIQKAGASVVDVVCVGEKIGLNGVNKVRRKFNLDVKSIVKFKIDDNKTKVVTS